MNTSTQPWRDHYPAGIDWNASIERRPLFETLEATANRSPDKTAIDFLDYCKYGELLEQQAAKGLQEWGSPRGLGWALPAQHSLLRNLLLRCTSRRCDGRQLQPALRGTRARIPDR